MKEPRPADQADSPAKGPYIPASTVLPEVTLKAVFLGVILAMALAGANAYLGLFAGMTVSASIPAAVISMFVLRFFRSSNILENNIVQTAASAGESLAAGVIFTLPALIILGAWTEFGYWQTTAIAALGGVLGVLFTIPLRRTLIVDEPLKFPEGVATAEVLKSGQEGGRSVWVLAQAGMVGILFKFGETGLHLWTATLEKARYVGSSIAYFGTNLSPALVGVGYIVGLNIAVLIFAGGAFSWFIALPIYAAVHGHPDGSAVEVAGQLWSTKIRYIGVGAMVIGGLWALVSLTQPILRGIKASLAAFKQGEGQSRLRTETDTPMKWVLWGSGVLVVPVFAVYYSIIKNVPVSAFMALGMVVAGFLFSSVAAYMAGLVGSSNNPISGVTIATILSSSLLLSVLLGKGSAIGPAAAILIGAVVCCAAAIAGDNLQDLKAGHILGATPIKQQFMQIVGVLSAAVVMSPILMLLLKGYGFVGAPGDAEGVLAAPQATLMASVARGVFQGDLPWNMVIIGAVVGAVIIVIDQVLKARGSTFRAPVLAVAVGIYLPFELSVPIFAGGLIAWATGRYRERRRALAPESFDEASLLSGRMGLLFAAGLITGEAFIGILMTIPIIVAEDKNVFAVLDSPVAWPGLLLLVGVCVWLYTLVARTFRERLAGQGG